MPDTPDNPIGTYRPHANARTIPPGTKFARLTVREPGPIVKQRSTSICDCVCGNVATALNKRLLNGMTSSCGCLKNEGNNFKHGHALAGNPSRMYQQWQNMVKRCCNPNATQFECWGGRGIRVCERWRNSFPAFLEDMGECPPGLEIDRWPDKNGNYSCGKCDECLRNGWKFNCRWATKKEQARNKRDNLVFTVRGTTACLAELCERFGLDYVRTHCRLTAGWDIERALFQPVANRGQLKASESREAK